MTWQTDLRLDMAKARAQMNESRKLLDKCTAIIKDGAILPTDDLEQFYADATEIAKDCIAVRKALKVRITQRVENEARPVLKKKLLQ